VTAEIHQFMDSNGRIDLTAWRHDICARLMTEYVGPENGITTKELCKMYFGYVDLEKLIFVGDQMQAAREMLQERQQPMILRNRHRQWYVVAPDDTAGARGFIVDRAKRFIRSHVRLRKVSKIGQETYQLPPGDPVVRAIERTTPGVRQIEGAIELPEPEEDQANQHN